MLKVGNIGSEKKQTIEMLQEMTHQDTARHTQLAAQPVESGPPAAL